MGGACGVASLPAVYFEPGTPRSRFTFHASGDIEAASCATTGEALAGGPDDGRAVEELAANNASATADPEGEPGPGPNHDQHRNRNSDHIHDHDHCHDHGTYGRDHHLDHDSHLNPGDVLKAAPVARKRQVPSRGVACKFDHTPGATVCTHLFPHYSLGDGRVVHVFRDARVRGVEGWPATLASIQDRLVARDVVAAGVACPQTAPPPLAPPWPMFSGGDPLMELPVGPLSVVVPHPQEPVTRWTSFPVLPGCQPTRGAVASRPESRAFALRGFAKVPLFFDDPQVVLR